ncbi:TetR/AcrR family transcriptional regulator [Vannielia sp.]|uniref:TetR/AcrR family transcriptional regulator n=1 Tax=Vannielia sp. TaxID=2813045 RepID=UPI00262F372F|nr:TetR/AcrR family transcriptional regulator [Vannielia sp.]MDF1871410.1 TetR/AcrR family transcriptional regulator [Vannielia sp.]
MIKDRRQPKTQSRTLRTRAKLIATAEALVTADGFAALRVEQVVQGAGVAKGTFFAHFPDKDALMERLIAARLDAALDRLDPAQRPESPDALVEALALFIKGATAERYVLDLVMRRAMVPPRADPGPIARALARLDGVLVQWFGGFFGAPPFRTDLPPEMLAEGVRALLMQAMELKFCSRHGNTSAKARLKGYVDAFLMPPNA